MSALLKFLNSSSGLFIEDINRIVANAPLRYKHYSIPKRNGEPRPIDQPAKEVKLLQRLLVEYLSEICPVHVAATAYKQGASISKNAKHHSNNDVILKLDFRNFFTSLNEKHWSQFCEQKGIFDKIDTYVSKQILFMQSYRRIYKVLAIGAPSSPTISNMLMYDFDEAISTLVRDDSVTYTRYADDMIFSAKRVGNLRYVEQQIKSTLRELNLKNLKINDDKTVLATKKYRRNVTGLILTNDNQISLGRDWKRMISAEIHHAIRGLKTDEEIESLLGKLSYAKSVEPDF